MGGLGAHGGTERVMMLTSDVALIKDPEEKYQDIVKEFAENPKALDEAFAAAWHKLTTSAFGNEEIARCTGQPPVTRDAPEDSAPIMLLTKPLTKLLMTPLTKPVMKLLMKAPKKLLKPPTKLLMVRTLFLESLCTF